MALRLVAFWLPPAVLGARVLGNQGRTLLDAVYAAFSNRSEDLLEAVSDPRQLSDSDIAEDRWTDVGDWLALAARLGAEKVLFVRGDPVAVFSELSTAPSEAALGELYRRAWCMSEPRCLFIALPDELRIYTLNRPPAREAPPCEPWRVLASAADVLTLTKNIDDFDADLNRLFEAQTSAPARADRRLIDDLTHVRQQLESTGLSMAEAHALIGRSILVRYLEDRGVLTRAYFERVAGENSAWKRALDAEGATPVFGASRRERLYDRVLVDAAFTHAFFNRLAEDFNGDLFSLGEARNKRFAKPALTLLRSFLLGEIQAKQQPLFFWAYDFEVVPLALISSIYEQFYHDSQSRSDSSRPQKELLELFDRGSESDDVDQDEGGANSDTGTHYTPSSLVHDALRRTLTTACLARTPRVLDLACGSGIFLVEAFRRIVRFEAQRQRRKLRPDELRHILQHRLAGVEVNAEAARVAAFSLYLALLDQQEPSDINAGEPLPCLIHKDVRDNENYGILVVTDAFSLAQED